MNDFKFVRMYLGISPYHCGQLEDWWIDVYNGTATWSCNMYGSLEGAIRACHRSQLPWR